MPPISVIVITRNEAEGLAETLRTVSWAAELIVVDAESTDGTAAIARQFTDRVYVRRWNGYSDQKNHAAGLAQHDWILSVDADEHVTPELTREIADLLRVEPAARGYRIPRVSFHLGRWIRSTDWYPDYQLRLYDRRAGHWQGLFVHESVRVDGPVGRLRGELHHYPYRDLSEQLIRMDRYTALAAQQMLVQGRRATVADIIARPPFTFFRNYVLRRGFTAGAAGLIISLVNSYYVMLKFAKLWELQNKGDK